MVGALNVFTSDEVRKVELGHGSSVEAIVERSSCYLRAQKHFVSNQYNGKVLLLPLFTLVDNPALIQHLN